MIILIEGIKLLSTNQNVKSIYKISIFPLLLLMKISFPSTITDALKISSSFMVSKTNCPFCHEASGILKERNVSFKEYNVDDLSGRESIQKLALEIMNKEKHKTFPMIYLNGKFVGGCDKLKEHYYREDEKENIKDRL